MHELDLWVMPVLNWEQLMQSSTYQALNIEQQLSMENNKEITTTRCPIRYNKQHFLSSKPAPKLGEHTKELKKELEKKKIWSF